MSHPTSLPSTRNYGPTVLVQQEARKQGCEQVLWLYGPDHQLTEVGTMNIFVYWTHEDGGEPSRDPAKPWWEWVAPSLLAGYRPQGFWDGGKGVAPKTGVLGAER